MATPYKKSLVTPIGTMSYPWLTQGNPDIRFGAPGKYKVNLIISGPEAAEFKAKVDEIKVEALAHLQKDNPKLADLVVPMDLHKDENGVDIPGTYVVKPKANAAFRRPDGTEEPNKLVIVDADKKPVPEGTAIWSGSKGKVAISVGAIDSGVYKGLVFRIAAVQVTELVEGGAGGASSMFEREDGYSAPEVAKEDTRVEESTDADPVHF